MDQAVRPQRVFISYARYSDSHNEQVRALWHFLRSNGIDAQLDVSAAGQRQDWAVWMAKEIRRADRVLVVASAVYRERAEGLAAADVGRGVQWEARLIRDAFYADSRTLGRFVPVVLPDQSVAGVPDFLAPATSTVYHVSGFTLAGAEELLRLLTNQPANPEPRLGKLPVFRRQPLPAPPTSASLAAPPLSLVPPPASDSTWARTSIDDLADDLASKVTAQWDEESTKRRMRRGKLASALPVTWHVSERPIAGNPIYATEKPMREFDPLPGLTAITEADLDRMQANRKHTQANPDATHTDLYRVYGGLKSGRLILSGEAGSGKTYRTILLLLEALRFRKDASLATRPRIPVPVLFTLHGWNPLGGVSAVEWVTDQIARTYRGYRLFRWRRRQVMRLVNSGRVAVFLDGLDEIPKENRVPVQRALADAPFRVVVLTRLDEAVTAASEHPVEDALALELDPLTPSAAKSFIEAALTKPAPDSWKKIIELLDKDHANNGSTRPLLAALHNPFTLSLLQDTYTPDDPVDELLDTGKFSDSAKIDARLLDRAVNAAYKHTPGRPPLPYSAKTATRTLEYVAKQLDPKQNAGLGWEDLPSWVRPAGLQTLVNTVAGAAMGAVLGVVWGLMYLAATHVIYAQPAGLQDWLSGGLVYGASFGGAGAFLVRYSRKRALAEDKRSTWWKHLISFDLRALRLTAAAAAGTAAWLVPGGDIGPGGGLAVGLVVAVVAGLAGRLVETGGASPTTAWRMDLKSALATGLVFGVVIGLVIGAALVWLRSSTGYWLVVGPVLGVPLGIGAGLVHSRVWATVIAQTCLFATHRTPLRLVHFLEDARSRKLLRTLGSSYQFRHNLLHVRLREKTSSTTDDR